VGARSGRRSILLQVDLGHRRVLQFFDLEKNSDMRMLVRLCALFSTYPPLAMSVLDSGFCRLTCLVPCCPATQFLCFSSIWKRIRSLHISCKHLIAAYVRELYHCDKKMAAVLTGSRTVVQWHMFRV
jgi:hypothetical protein